MPLDDLIPIGGASKGSSGPKKSGGNDLTSGLISISGARDNVDVDMSDFDVGDLLGDDSSKKKSKSSSKDKSDDKKKHKSKDKDKAKSSSSSKKKSKSKSKKNAFDDDDFGDDTDNWTSSTKNWGSTAELEMAAAAAARRKNGGKIGGGLDDEFAKMLGGDIGGTDTGTTESPPLSPEPFGKRDDGNDDTFGISGYTPTVRGSNKSREVEVPPTFDANESAKPSDGISASFFQDDTKGNMNSTSLSSMLGTSTDRRGGTRGRRQVGGAESDPFGIGASATTSSSNFDSLFGGSSSRRGGFDDPFAKPTRDSSDDIDTRQSVKEHVEERKASQVQADPPPLPTQRLSAKDDLLADLFPSEPRSSARGGRRQQESSILKNEETVDEKKAKVELPSDPVSTILPVSADPGKQQNDLLAELFSTPTNNAVYDKPKEKEEEPKKSASVEIKPSTPPTELTPPKKEESFVDSVLPESSKSDVASARDSLLMDLLGGLSPPKPREPVSSRRRSRGTNSNDSSPNKEMTKVEDPFKSSLPPSPVQSQPLASVPEILVETSPPLTSERPTTPPSPGRIRSLTTGKGALESNFEQSKANLLEEILPFSPAASAHSSPHRRNSYSQSFDVEDSIAEVAEEPIHEEEEQKAQVQEEPSTPEPIVIKSSPAEIKQEAKTFKQKPNRLQVGKNDEIQEMKVVCNCDEREKKLTATFEIECAALQQQLAELQQQLETQTTSNNQLTQQLTQQLEERETFANQLSHQLEERQALVNQLSQQLEARVAANTQLTQQLAATERDKLQADQLILSCKEDAANHQHRVELLETEIRALREELSRSKRAVQDAELTLARKMAEQDEADQLERHREKRALEALSAQMQRALARLTISHQVQEEGLGLDNSAARVAAEDEARLRVIASLEGSSKRAAQHAEQERLKLAELLRELEAGARNARQGALEDKERLRQEQQRLDALSAHLQAQTAALRDQEATHATYMVKQLAEAREDARVYEARLVTRRTQLERDERALYEARAEFAAFREQIALEIEHEHEELRASRLALEDAWRELRADREDLETELASHEEEFQALENMRQQVQDAEARLAERTQEVVALAEKLDAGTRELLEREQLVAQQAAMVQDTDTSFVSRERSLERGRKEMEAREQRLHAQIRQLDTARGRLTQQRREQQQLLAAARRQSTVQQPARPAVDNNKLWRLSNFTMEHRSNNFGSSSVVDNPKEKAWPEPHMEEDPSGLSPALRKQVEANWKRRNQLGGQRRQRSGLTFDVDNFAANVYPSSWFKDVNYTSKSSIADSAAKATRINTQQQLADQSLDPFKAPKYQKSTSATTSQTGIQRLHSARASNQPPPSTTRTFQPTLRVNL
ncbi:hypothetical protein L915_10040 [Phytophthora nicotianae]|uniref:Uncharacterized protein n=1 Tax=Phytophthora nicotianae TaxID=4792 RepID=W2GS03_PHYNI|nr:hypothetical protein L915_10040 [Phytophthora nicotianae]